ncbi:MULTISPECIES: hypothetical protein [unclassified Rhizobium]|uniref:hypothetical protein n=1 Tax=unclassified Rhizobium TaxID=2613769 RepID=UPI00161C00B7|nr:MULTISPECIES: hypothetical protein [unclassified Rhizobium]MBB3539359.1 hypothetical protein [Rhizobium sp. BK399]MCS3741251.1 hypothetical protein [Rhizobium sp. BK661]MCS4093415.1 hypothetical protein [Rhizobium sp. BK176]
MSASDITQMIEAFDRLAAAGFIVGPEWQAVHEVCQAHEGEALFDWGHAICHRIEGDDWNADYWYRQAGKRRGNAKVADEWSVMKAELFKQL